MFEPFLSASVIGRAREAGIIGAEALDIRRHAAGRHSVVDDRPFGGGAGMVMKPEPLTAAVREAKRGLPEAPVVFLSPQGRVFDQALAHELASHPGLILVCGRYEGLDERVIQSSVDLEVSIGDYVLSGGEPAAMVVLDAVARLVPGVLGREDSAANDSFEDGLLEHPHYTRPREFEGLDVPDVLCGGNHAAIEQWRREASLARTLYRRPELLRERNLSREERAVLERWRREIGEVLESGDLSVTGPLPGGKQKG